MRFRLLEAEFKDIEQYIEIMKDPKKSREERLEACLYYVQKQGYDKLSNILQKKSKNAYQLFEVILAVLDMGPAVSEKFDYILSRVPIDQISIDNYQNLIALGNIMKNTPNFKYKANYLLNPSLYDRSQEDFVYTVNQFNIVNDPSLSAKKFIGKSVSEDSLIDNGVIKPAGIDKKDPKDSSTIYGVVNGTEDGNATDALKNELRGSKFYKVYETCIKDGDKNKGKESADILAKAVSEASRSSNEALFDVFRKLDLQRIPRSYYPNLLGLVKLTDEKDINVTKKYLLDYSLYTRSASDFNYTVGVMDVVNNEAKLRKYYDPKKITPEDLYDGNGIKPAGISAKDPNDFNTIYGVLETWKESAPTDGTPKPAKDKDKKSKYEYSSFEDAEEENMDQDGSIIKINGKFKFNGKNKKWEPVNK